MEGYSSSGRVLSRLQYACGGGKSLVVLSFFFHVSTVEVRRWEEWFTAPHLRCRGGYLSVKARCVREGSPVFLV